MGIKQTFQCYANNFSFSGSTVMFELSKSSFQISLEICKDKIGFPPLGTLK